MALWPLIVFASVEWNFPSNPQARLCAKAEIKARFSLTPSAPYQVVVSMTVTGIETKVYFTVEVEKNLGVPEMIGYRGHVIEDHFETKAQIVAFVTGEPWTFKDEFYSIKLELGGDPSSINRELTALEIMRDNRGLPRES